MDKKSRCTIHVNKIQIIEEEVKLCLNMYSVDENIPCSRIEYLLCILSRMWDYIDMLPYVSLFMTKYLLSDGGYRYPTKVEPLPTSSTRGDMY